MASKLIIFLALMISTNPCLPGQGNGNTISEKEPNTAEPRLSSPYVIQPNDVLEVFVWKEPELTRKVFVRPDGRISFPLVQDMPAAGISPGDLKARIEERLKDYMDSPNVTIIVEAIQSYKIYVTGKVKKPGSMMVEKPVTVLQAIPLAGGFEEYANDSEITIIRNNGNENILLNFNYKDVIKGRKPEQNIVLRSGDVVVVP
jgi:polysaccharide biosynthesis/export protein